MQLYNFNKINVMRNLNVRCVVLVKDIVVSRKSESRDEVVSLDLSLSDLYGRFSLSLFSSVSKMSVLMQYLQEQYLQYQYLSISWLGYNNIIQKCSVIRIFTGFKIMIWIFVCDFCLYCSPCTVKWLTTKLMESWKPIIGLSLCVSTTVNASSVEGGGRSVCVSVAVNLIYGLWILFILNLMQNLLI